MKTKPQIEKTYGRVPRSWISLLKGRGELAARLAMALAAYADKDGRCWPSIRTLAADLGVTERSVTRALNTLRRVSIIVNTTQRANNSNVYELALGVTAVSPLANGSGCHPETFTGDISAREGDVGVTRRGDNSVLIKQTIGTDQLEQTITKQTNFEQTTGNWCKGENSSQAEILPTTDGLRLTYRQFAANLGFRTLGSLDAEERQRLCKYLTLEFNDVPGGPSLLGTWAKELNASLDKKLTGSSREDWRRTTVDELVTHCREWQEEAADYLVTFDVLEEAVSLSLPF